MLVDEVPDFDAMWPRDSRNCADSVPERHIARPSLRRGSNRSPAVVGNGDEKEEEEEEEEEEEGEGGGGGTPGASVVTLGRCGKKNDDGGAAEVGAAAADGEAPRDDR